MGGFDTVIALMVSVVGRCARAYGEERMRAMAHTVWKRELTLSIRNPYRKKSIERRV